MIEYRNISVPAGSAAEAYRAALLELRAALDCAEDEGAREKRIERVTLEGGLSFERALPSRVDEAIGLMEAAGRAARREIGARAVQGMRIEMLLGRIPAESAA